MGFRVGENRVAIRDDAKEDQTASGLFVPESGQSILQYGTITHVGVIRNSDGYAQDNIDFEVGDRAFYHRMSGQPIEIDGIEYRFLSPGEIIGIVEPEDFDEEGLDID